jgi:putative FmdB family regulatory protein
MPRYIYKCTACEIVFQKAHSIKEKLKDCEECESEDTLQRLPSMPLILTKKQGEEKREVGSLVKDYIEDVRKELKQEKKELSNQVYEDD